MNENEVGGIVVNCAVKTHMRPGPFFCLMRAPMINAQVLSDFSDAIRRTRKREQIPMKGRWLYSLMIATLTVEGAGEIEYLADMNESAWEFAGSKSVCELRHTVPFYGITEFRLPADGELRFKVEAFRPAPYKGTAILREESPSWLHEGPEASELPVPVSAGTQPIALKGDYARWLLNTLARGRIGSFDFHEGKDSWTKVRVSVSPVNFQKPYADFRMCTKQLMPPGPAPEDLHDIRFPTDVSSLDRKDRAQLKRVIKRVTADKNVTEIAVRGHADSRGTNRYNQGLSARRAQSVSRYLMWNGLQGKKISVMAFGETKPKGNNASKTGRAANRRVEVELIRTPQAGE